MNDGSAVDAASRLACEVFGDLRWVAGPRRAARLRTVADNLEAADHAIVQCVQFETAIGSDRVRAEIVEADHDRPSSQVVADRPLPTGEINTAECI
jgi:hypothetical protein